MADVHELDLPTARVALACTGKLSGPEAKSGLVCQRRALNGQGGFCSGGIDSTCASKLS